MRGLWRLKKLLLNMANTQYITLDGDRWDSVAVKAYGACDGTQIRVLQNANPFLQKTFIFKAGVKLTVPIIEEEQTLSDITLPLPPWKRVKPEVPTETSLTTVKPTNTGFDSSFG